MSAVSPMEIISASSESEDELVYGTFKNLENGRSSGLTNRNIISSIDRTMEINNSPYSIEAFTQSVTSCYKVPENSLSEYNCLEQQRGQNMETKNGDQKSVVNFQDDSLMFGKIEQQNNREKNEAGQQVRKNYFQNKHFIENCGVGDSADPLNGKVIHESSLNNVAHTDIEVQIENEDILKKYQINSRHTELGITQTEYTNLDFDFNWIPSSIGDIERKIFVDTTVDKLSVNGLKSDEHKNDTLFNHDADSQNLFRTPDEENILDFHSQPLFPSQISESQNFRAYQTDEVKLDAGMDSDNTLFCSLDQTLLQAAPISYIGNISSELKNVSCFETEICEETPNVHCILDWDKTANVNSFNLSLKDAVENISRSENEYAVSNHSVEVDLEPSPSLLESLRDKNCVTLDQDEGKSNSSKDANLQSDIRQDIVDEYRKEIPEGFYSGNELCHFSQNGYSTKNVLLPLNSKDVQNGDSYGCLQPFDQVKDSVNTTKITEENKKIVDNLDSNLNTITHSKNKYLFKNKNKSPEIISLDMNDVDDTNKNTKAKIFKSGSSRYQKRFVRPWKTEVDSLEENVESHTLEKTNKASRNAFPPDTSVTSPKTIQENYTDSPKQSTSRNGRLVRFPPGLQSISLNNTVSDQTETSLEEANAAEVFSQVEIIEQKESNTATESQINKNRELYKRERILIENNFDYICTRNPSFDFKGETPVQKALERSSDLISFDGKYHSTLKQPNDESNCVDSQLKLGENCALQKSSDNYSTSMDFETVEKSLHKDKNNFNFVGNFGHMMRKTEVKNIFNVLKSVIKDSSHSMTNTNLKEGSMLGHGQENLCTAQVSDTEGGHFPMLSKGRNSAECYSEKRDIETNFVDESFGECMKKGYKYEKTTNNGSENNKEGSDTEITHCSELPGTEEIPLKCSPKEGNREAIDKQKFCRSKKDTVSGAKNISVSSITPVKDPVADFTSSEQNLHVRGESPNIDDNSEPPSNTSNNNNAQQRKEREITDNYLKKDEIDSGDCTITGRSTADLLQNKEQRMRIEANDKRRKRGRQDSECILNTQSTSNKSSPTKRNTRSSYKKRESGCCNSECQLEEYSTNTVANSEQHDLSSTFNRLFQDLNKGVRGRRKSLRGKSKRGKNSSMNEEFLIEMISRKIHSIDKIVTKEKSKHLVNLKNVLQAYSMLMQLQPVLTKIEIIFDSQKIGNNMKLLLKKKNFLKKYYEDLCFKINTMIHRSRNMKPKTGVLNIGKHSRMDDDSETIFRSSNQELGRNFDLAVNENKHQVIDAWNESVMEKTGLVFNGKDVSEDASAVNKKVQRMKNSYSQKNTKEIRITRETSDTLQNSVSCNINDIMPSSVGKNVDENCSKIKYMAHGRITSEIPFSNPRFDKMTKEALFKLNNVEKSSLKNICQENAEERERANPKLLNSEEIILESITLGSQSKSSDNKCIRPHEKLNSKYSGIYTSDISIITLNEVKHENTLNVNTSQRTKAGWENEKLIEETTNNEICKTGFNGKNYNENKNNRLRLVIESEEKNDLGDSVRRTEDLPSQSLLQNQYQTHPVFYSVIHEKEPYDLFEQKQNLKGNKFESAKSNNAVSIVTESEPGYSTTPCNNFTTLPLINVLNEQICQKLPIVTRSCDSEKNVVPPSQNDQIPGPLPLNKSLKNSTQSLKVTDYNIYVPKAVASDQKLVATKETFIVNDLKHKILSNTEKSTSQMMCNNKDQNASFNSCFNVVKNKVTSKKVIKPDLWGLLNCGIIKPDYRGLTAHTPEKLIFASVHESGHIISDSGKSYSKVLQWCMTIPGFFQANQKPTKALCYNRVYYQGRCLSYYKDSYDAHIAQKDKSKINRNCPDAKDCSTGPEGGGLLPIVLNLTKMKLLLIGDNEVGEATTEIDQWADIDRW